MEENNNIVYKNNNGIEYIQFKRLLELGIKHAYTLKGENVDFTSTSELLKPSYEKILGALDLNMENLVTPKQTHTDSVKCIDKVDAIQDLYGIDGLITDKENIVLSTKNADCILFLIYDPVKKVIANVHSGWRGTFKKILEKAIMKMVTNYGSKAEDIICCICPSIRRCHFEVDEDVMNLCEDIFSFTGKTKEFIEKGEIKEGKQKYYIDTVKINEILLKNLGVKEENIIDSNLCSMCHSDKISSCRVEGKTFTRCTAIISLD